MKKITLLIILGLLININLKGQTRYFEFKLQAERFMENENYIESARFYEKAFNEKEGTKRDYFNSACSWTLSKKDDKKAFKYLEQSIEKGMYDLEKLDTEEKLNLLRKEPMWESIRQKLIDKKTNFENGLNKPLKTKLEKIFYQDQTVRKIYNLARKSEEIDSIGMEYILNLMNTEDSICQKEVVKILDTYGWLGIDEVGELGNKAIWIVIQHAPLEIQEKYYSKMEESVKEGQSDGSNFAYLVDRILMRKNEKQLYGSQYRFDRETKTRYFYPIADYENVNKRREEVGLMPIEEYARLIKLEYNPSQWDE